MENRKVVLYIDRNEKDILINQAQDAIKKFLKKYCPNHQICPNGQFDIGDIGLVWSLPSRFKIDTQNRWKIHKLHRQNQKPLIVFERGFLRRDIYFSVGWNNIVNFGYYCNKNMPSDRFDKIPDLVVKPHIPNRNKEKGYVLICGQIPWDAQLQHLPNYKKWLINLVTDIKKYTNRKIVYRPHPKQKSSNPMSVTMLHGTTTSKVPTLEEDIKKAWVVLSFNSNSLVEALLEGVPFFSFDSGSMVHDIANHELSKIETPTFPDSQTRMQTLYDIAYSQYTLDEIESGVFWTHLIHEAKKSMNIDSHYHKLKEILW